MKTLINSLIIGAGVVLLVGSCAGCARITYTKGDTKVSSTRAFWKTESYVCRIETNGIATLEVNKSGVDTEALNSALTAVTTAITAVK